jgi:putative ABC transport system permease protein
MAIPVSYNLRNLVVRKTTTLMTALGVALTVAVLLAVLALVNGLRTTLASSGDPLQIIVLRKGSESEIVSNFTRTQFQDLKFKPGIAAGANGQPLASLEVITVVNLGSTEGGEGTNVTVRGLQPAGLEMRRGVKIAAGRWFQEGKRELVVGKSAADRYPEVQIGRKIRFGRGDWDIVGIMDAGRGAQASELWGDLNQVGSDLQRLEVLSSALVRATDEVTAKALANDINNDQRLNMNAVDEVQYYAAQTSSAAIIEYIGIFVAVIMAVGSAFAAMNTMYAAVARRSREIGTLRVLGFSKGSILLSFFLESVLLSALGGVLGCLLVLPLNGITTGIGNSNFSETAFNFHVSPQIMMIGIAFAVILGAAGGLFPASNAARKEILTALREI